MTESAAQTQFRQEMIATFEFGESILRDMTVKEAVIKGNTATFLVAGSGGATAVTRGLNGLIPARANDLTQTSATLAEWHDLARASGFNIFQSQGDMRQLMARTTVEVINRKIDADIIAQLDAATLDTGNSATFSVAMVAKALAKLGNNEVNIQDTANMFGLMSPTAWSYAMQLTEFSSGDYVETKTFSGAIRRYWHWFGINWAMHPNLTGVETSTEKMYVWHRNSIGHAFDTAGMKTSIGYDEEQDYSYARCTAYMGSKLLQNAGVIQLKHDGSVSALS